jgi:hypothetical protein
VAAEENGGPGGCGAFGKEDVGGKGLSICEVELATPEQGSVMRGDVDENG